MHTNIKILHLEDEPSDALLVSHTLRQSDFRFECLVVDTREKFLSALNDFEPDLILSDHSLPSFNSFEAMDLLKNLEKRVPVILVTATMTDEFAVNAIKRGARDYILKDRLGRLPSAIKNVLETLRLEKEREGFLIQLQRNERKFRRLIENGADAVAVFTPDGTINYITPSVRRILGYSVKEALEVNIYEIIHEDDREIALEILKECLEKPEIPFKDYQVRLRHKDASWRCLEISLTNLMQDLAIEGIVADFRDVTERKLAEKTIKESEEKYRQLFENSPLPNVIYDKDTFEILDVNKAALDHYSFTREEFLRLTILDFIPKEEIFDFKKTISTLPVNGGEVRHNSIINLKKSGEHIHVETFGYGLQYKERNCRLVIFFDITERKNSLEKLVKSEARFRGLIQSQTNYVIRTDLQGRYTYGNKKFRDDFGWIHGQKEIVGQDSMVSINEYHHSRVQSVVEKCLSNPDQVFQVEIDKPTKKGGVKTTLWDFIYLKGVTTEHDEVQCVGIDISDRVKADKALKESNLRYELVSKATSDVIYDWDIKSNALIYSEAFYAMSGYSQNEFSPTIEDFLEKIHPEEKHLITQSLTLGIEGTDNHWKAEYRFKKADGKYAYVNEKGFILRDESGKAFRMVGAIQDVTEKKKLEELLDEASRFARIGSFEIDCEKDIMYWSSVTKEIHEVDVAYCPTLEKGILFYKEGESRDAMSNAYIEALNKNIPYDLEMQIITEKGRERWIRKIGQPTFVDGKCVRINGSFQDITNIKNSELEALKASEEKEIILESIGDAFFMVDNDWTVTYWNQHSDRLLDSHTEEILGRNFWDVFPDAIDTKFFSFYHKAVREQSIENFEEYFERLHKWFEVTAYPSNNGLSVYFKDVTERKESELQIIELNNNLKAYTEELVEANKGLEQFSFIVSHNLRSPVANILGLAELINDEEYSQEVKNSFLQALFDNVKRLDVVITDLNAILQVKVEMDAKKETVELNHLVGTIKTSIQNLIEKEKVQITTHLDVPSIHTVQSYLYSIFYNLIANSIKYRQPGTPPQIDIKSEMIDESVVITFRDNGLGIDLVKKGDQVFGLYRRFHHHIEGKGMGLFLVKTQVELLGGKISIESEVNVGTKFTITFKEKDLNYNSEYEQETALYSGR